MLGSNDKKNPSPMYVEFHNEFDHDNVEFPNDFDHEKDNFLGLVYDNGWLKEWTHWYLWSTSISSIIKLSGLIIYSLPLYI